MLIRSWNLFHGNTVPPQRQAFLDEMLRRATADEPDVLCLQELPAWALTRFTVGDVAALHRIAERMQHLGNPGHADAADADEVDGADRER